MLKGYLNFPLFFYDSVARNSMYGAPRSTKTLAQPMSCVLSYLNGLLCVSSIFYLLDLFMEFSCRNSKLTNDDSRNEMWHVL